MEKKLKKKKIIQSIFIVILIFTIIIICFIYYIFVLFKNQEKDIDFNLNEINTQLINSLKSEMSGYFKTLNSISNSIDYFEELEENTILEYCKTQNSLVKFSKIGIIKADGIGNLVDSTDPDNVVYKQNIDFSKSVFFNRSLMGEQFFISGKTEKLIENNEKLLSVPIDKDGSIIGVVYACVSSEGVDNILNLSAFSGNCNSAIVTSKGDFIVNLSNETQQTNIFESSLKTIPLNDKTKMAENMSNNESGTVHYLSNHTKYVASYMPLGVNNWYVICLVPSSVINSNFMRIIYISIGMIAVSLMLFIILIIRINSITKKNHNKIKKLAYYDTLTGAYNKNKFNQITDKAIRINPENYALVIIDINNFKALNQIFGYDEGDLILKYIVQTFAHKLNNDEVYARIFADKFIILLKHNGEDSIKKRLNIIMNIISSYKSSKSFSNLVICRSAVYLIKTEDQNVDINTLIDRATSALHHNKNKSSNSIVFHNNEIYLQTKLQNEIESQMHFSLKNNEFVVYFQPKVNVTTGEIIGAEALVRWQHPEKGLLMPAAFIPIFEQNGFITQLDIYVFENVCRVLHNWIEDGHEPFHVSINQSRLLLYKNDYIQKLKMIIKKYNIPVNIIELEITESIIFENHQIISNIIDELHKIGFSVSMDDFGSGYSSLNILKDVPFDVLKLDRLFFDEASDTKKGKDIIQSIIDMAKKLSITTVSEGVETIEQLNFLKTTDCNIAQGYYFSRPISYNEFIDLLISKGY